MSIILKNNFLNHIKTFMYFSEKRSLRKFNIRLILFIMTYHNNIVVLLHKTINIYSSSTILFVILIKFLTSKTLNKDLNCAEVKDSKAFLAMILYRQGIFGNGNISRVWKGEMEIKNTHPLAFKIKFWRFNEQIHKTFINGNYHLIFDCCL